MPPACPREVRLGGGCVAPNQVTKVATSGVKRAARHRVSGAVSRRASARTRHASVDCEMCSFSSVIAGCLRTWGQSYHLCHGP